MRDIFIDQIYNKMRKDRTIFFLSGDFGSPVLDKIRKEFKGRFINVGIAEQNLINISTGLALEGFIVYAYGIAPFLTMRAYEQIRVNLSLLSQLKAINVNLIGVGAGLSYDVSGPTHHCLEDITIMRVLPHFILFSPSDCVLTEKFVDYTINIKRPKYIRLEGKPLPQIYKENSRLNLAWGFCELSRGNKICIVSTGYMTHVALKVAKKLAEDKIQAGVIDIFLLKPVNEASLFRALRKYAVIITMEEAFINKGGLDSIISSIFRNRNSGIILKGLGFKEKYLFGGGNREYLHKLNGLDEDSVRGTIRKLLR
jgi:transketolase